MSEGKQQRGSIEKTPVAQVMAFVFRKELSGTLMVSDTEGHEYKIYFLEGLPSYVEGMGLKHSVGEIVVDAGLLSEEELEESVVKSKEQGMLLGQYLLQEGILDQRQIDTAVRIQTRKRIQDIFGIFEGEFSFHPEENLTNFVFEGMVKTNLQAILPESLRLTWSDERIARKLEDIRPYEFTIDDYEACRKSFGWNRREIAALEKLDGREWTLHRVESEAGSEMKHYRIVLYALILAGKLSYMSEDESREVKRREQEMEKKRQAMVEPMENKLRQIKEGTHFDMLEVGLEVEADEIKDNYIRLLKTFHPDRVEPFKDEKLKWGFERISAKLKESMAVLTNAEERDKYVKHLKGEEDKEEEEQEIVRSVLTDELAYQKVLVLMNKRKYEEIVELMEPIYKKETSNGEYIAAYAWAKVALSPRGATMKEYIDVLKKAHELSPRSERVNFWLACALQKAGFVMGEWEQYMRATVEINPYNIEAQRQLHIIELKKKKDKKSALGGLGDIRKSFIGSKISGFLKKKKEKKE